MRKIIFMLLAGMLVLSGCHSGDASINGIIFKRDHYPEREVAGVRGTAIISEKWTVSYAECDTEDACSRRPGVAEITREEFEACKVGDWFPDCTRSPSK